MIIVKLGGSAITVKEGYMEANNAGIARLSGAVAKAWKSGMRDIILVHGAGSFGHALVLKYGINEGVRSAKQKEGCRKTQEACAELSGLVVSALKKKGAPAVSLAPHALIASKNRRIAKFDTAPVFTCLKAGKLPVLYGDMVQDSRLGFSVCSGDQIISYLGRKAARIVLASNVDGVFADGKLVKKITRSSFSRIKRHLSGSKTPDVTGGMAGKIAELMKVKAPCYVVNASRPERVLALILGKKAVCTEIRF
jgi:isopentenyl phosphate kinase